MRSGLKKTDVAIIGGGIIGTSAATFLAEAGQSVVLFEQDEIAAGASGRNSGALQHPFDPQFVDLHRRSIPLYRELTAADDGFELAARPAGLMLISFDEEATTAVVAAIERDWPKLAPVLLGPGEASAAEPSLDPGLLACRLETGYPVAPAVATLAFARRARRAGAQLVTGIAAMPIVESGRIAGVLLGDGDRLACDQVLVAAGPWTPSLIPGWAKRPFIVSMWGVVVSTKLAVPPVHVLEEFGIDSQDARAGGLFSLVSIGQSASVGSTFLDAEPDSGALAPAIMDRARAFVPELSRAEIMSVRACARPVTLDGWPVIGAVDGIEGLFVCAGHGPWGISTGPASSRLIVDQMLGMAEELAEFSPARVATA